MDNLDIMMKQKKFFKAIYRNISENEYIRIFQNNKGVNIPKDKEFSKVEFFNDIDELVKYCTTNRFGLNTYYELATTNGQDGTTDNLIKRYSLDFDFDKKDEEDGFDHKDVINRFKALGLWYHSMQTSGGGYHCHMVIEPTDDFKKVEAVQIKLQTLLHADPNAVKMTQLLRVPYTFNIKEDKPRLVQTMVLFEKESIKPYNIDKLFNRFCRNVCDEQKEEIIGNKSTEAIMNTTNIPSCVNEILSKGSLEGERNAELQKIVVTLRRRNRTLSEILLTIKEWNNKCNPPLSDHEIKYQVEYLFENLKTVSYNCQECSHNEECFNNVISDFEYNDNDILLDMNEKILKSLRKSRKGVKSMEGNELLVYSVLKLHTDGLYRSELVKEMTYKGKCRLSENTMSKALKSLVDNNFITSKRDSKGTFYKITNEKTKIDETFTVGYGATLCCIKKEITTEELRLYNYMRFLHHKLQREGRSNLKGNLFQIDQRDLGDLIGKSQPQISEMINNLINEKLISLWYRGMSKNNQYDFNIYRLNV